MGSCCSSTVDSHGHAKKKVPAFAWSVAVKKKTYSPFSEAKEDILRPPDCLVPDGGQDPHNLQYLHAFELCPRWPPVQVTTGGVEGAAPWDSKAAVWLNTCWVKTQVALANHVHGRELVLHASFGGGLAAVLTSTGWLLRLVRKPKKEPWLQTLHILEMKAVQVSSGPLGFIVQIEGGAAPPGDPLPPADPKVKEAAMKKGIEHGASTISLDLTQPQAEKLVGSIVAAAIALKLRVPELRMEQGFKPTQVPTPAPQGDGGFATVFRAYMSYLGVPCAEVKVGLPFLEGLPFLQLDLSDFEPLGGSNLDSARTSYAIRAALRTCSNFKSMVRVDKPIGAAAWPSLCQAATSGSLFKVALPNCALDASMVLKLGEAMLKEKAPIMDLDLTGAQITDANAAAALAKGLEAVPAGLRRLVLARCGMTAATAPALLKVIAGVAGKKLEHLSLAGNAIGTLPAPHPLAGFLRSGKLQTLELQGTNLDMSMVLDSPGASDVPKGIAIKGINLSGTTCCIGGQQLPKPVEQFLVSLGKNLEKIVVADFMQSAMAVESYLRALANSPAKDFLLDMSGLQAAWVTEAICQVAKSGQLPGKGLVLDYVSANMEQTVPDAVFNSMEKEISLEFGKAAKAKAAEVAVPKGVVVAQPAVAPAELQKQIADQFLEKLRKSGTGRGAQLEQMGRALASAPTCKQLILAVPSAGQSKQVQLNHHMWASGDLSGPKAYTVLSMGVGPQAALLLAPMADSKDVVSLDLRGVFGGDVLGVVLGAVVLRSNRSIRSIQLQGNMISVNGWAAIRGAFYGNRKVIDFPFPENDVKSILELYRLRMVDTDQQVLACRGRIKRAFKSTKGARTPYVLGVLNQEVENIKKIKQEQARQRVTIKKYAKLQQEIQEAIARNQADEKNKAKQAKEFNNQWKEADKALEKATKLQEQKVQTLEQQKANIWRQRSTVMQQWTDRVTELRKKKKDVQWFEDWARMVAKPIGDPPVKRPVLSHDTAELLLGLVPDTLANDCKKEIAGTKDFIAAEMEIVAEQEMLQSRLEEQRCVAARVLDTASSARMAPPSQFSNVQAAVNQKVVTGTVVMPSETIVARPVQVQNTKLQATQYQQFQMHQAQQAQRAQDFNQRQRQPAPGRFASAFMFSQHQQMRRGQQQRGAGGHDSGMGGLMAMGYMGSSFNRPFYHSPYYHHYHDDYYDDHDDDPSRWDPNPEGRGEDFVVEDSGAGALDDLGVPPDGEGPGPVDIEEAAEAVDAYAGGEDDRIGGGPPSAGSRAAKDEIILKPTSPRLDVVEWFEEQIQHCERSALEATLGRLGPMPCQQEVLLRCGPAEPRGVCLVTQCSVDRLGRLEQQLCNWDGEVAVAIFIDAVAEGLAAATARRDIIATCSRAALRRSASGSSIAWTITVVYRLADAEVRCESYDRLYPVNTMRNVALRSARSELVFLIDVDFIPSRNLHATLCGSDAKLHSLTTALAGSGSDGGPLALVVPAFEVKSATVPRTFSELHDLVSQGDASGFHVSTFPRGHGGTNFGRWFEWTAGDATGAKSSSAAMNFDTHGIEAYSIEYTEHFEPYVVCHRAQVPVYEERFRGYGLNKISHLYDMATQGFRFCVLADHEAFVAAQQHPRSESWHKMYGADADVLHRARLSVHYAEFRKEVAARAGKLLRPLSKSKAELREEHVASTCLRAHDYTSEPDPFVTSEDVAAWLAALLIHMEKLVSAEGWQTSAAHAVTSAACSAPA